jgi:flavodoxin
MFRAAVIYAPAALQAVAERISAALDRKRFQVSVKPAEQASIPDLAAADLVLLGSSAQAQAGAPLPVEFAELLRALSGINLAGRVGGIFAAGSDAPLAAWKKALQDSDLRVDENLLRCDQADAQALRGWVVELARQVEELARGHAD